MDSQKQNAKCRQQQKLLVVKQKKIAGKQQQRNSVSTWNETL